MIRPLLLGTLVSASLAAQAGELPNRPVSALDLQRYSGQWHEIAHLPMFFQRKCKDTITATYTPRADGTHRRAQRLPHRRGQDGCLRWRGEDGGWTARGTEGPLRTGMAGVASAGLGRLLGGGAGPRLPMGRRGRPQPQIPVGALAQSVDERRPVPSRSWRVRASAVIRWTSWSWRHRWTERPRHVDRRCTCTGSRLTLLRRESADAFLADSPGECLARHSPCSARCGSCSTCCAATRSR